MSSPLTVGIDYGDLRIRAAYAQDGEAHLLPLQHSIDGPIYFDPYANISSLGVGFPTLLQTVGNDTPLSVGGATETAESLVTQRLAAIQRALLEATGQPAGPTVLAIPAALSQRRRRTLIGCAQQAGFQEPTLIDMGTAAAVGDHRDREEASTSLVYRLGYGDCEISLVRLARGRCRVVGSALLPRVSGEMLDALVMESVVLALREKRVFLGLKQFSSSDWLEFRHAAEVARVAMGTRPEVKMRLPPQLAKSGSVLSLRLSLAGFSLRVAPLVERTVDSILGLLEQNELTLSNVDRFLLVGGVARTPPVSDILASAFEHRPKPVPNATVAFGALLHASRLTGAPLRLPVVDDEPFAGAEGSTATTTLARRPEPGPSSDPRHEVFVLVEEKASEVRPPSEQRSAVAPPPSPPDGGLAQVRRLLDQGRVDEAEALLAQVADEVSTLRKEVQGAKPTGAQLLMRRARALLARGQGLEAVSVAHQAYDEAPDDPVVFSGMMAIHAEAALAMNQPEDYERSLQVLRCAHKHDQTDRSVHKAIAERHLIHAVAMGKRGNMAKALESVQAGLTFEPKHPELNRLLRELTTQPSTTD